MTKSYRLIREWSPSLHDYHYVLSVTGESWQRSGSREWAERMADKFGIEIDEKPDALER